MKTRIAKIVSGKEFVRRVKKYGHHVQLWHSTIQDNYYLTGMYPTLHTNEPYIRTKRITHEYAMKIYDAVTD